MILSHAYSHILTEFKQRDNNNNNNNNSNNKYDQKYDAIFKHVEINSSAQNSRTLPQPQQTSDRSLR